MVSPKWPESPTFKPILNWPVEKADDAARACTEATAAVLSAAVAADKACEAAFVAAQGVSKGPAKTALLASVEAAEKARAAEQGLATAARKATAAGRAAARVRSSVESFAAVVKKREDKLKHALGWAILEMQRVAEDLQQDALSCYTDEEFVDGHRLTSAARGMEAIAERLKMSSLECEADAMGKSFAMTGPEDDDTNLQEDIRFTLDHYFDEGPTLADWCDDNDVDIDDILDKYI